MQYHLIRHLINNKLKIEEISLYNFTLFIAIATLFALNLCKIFKNTPKKNPKKI